MGDSVHDSDLNHDSASNRRRDLINDHLCRLVALTREMMALADEGDRDRDDASCGILYGILRDTAYHLRLMAQQECQKHRLAGKWHQDTPPPGVAEVDD